jgi:hypothetical protein
MDVLNELFAERLKEIEAYLDLLVALEKQVQSGPPRVGGQGQVISTTQQRILYSSVYLQLYNLVEATITKCVEAVCDAIAKERKWKPSDLSLEIRREWVRHSARTHVDLNYDNRLLHSLELFNHLIGPTPVSSIEIDKGGGGNWNDEEIYRMAARLGCELVLSAEAQQAVKRPFKNDKGALALIVKMRNELAHGNVSFGECGEGHTADELRDLASRTGKYLSEVVASFKNFVETHAFLQPDSRPVLG